MPRAFADREAEHAHQSWLQAAVAALDDRLRVRHGVFEYSQSRDCLFRIEIAAADCDLTLSDGVQLRRGDRMIKLHIWNEQFPRFPEAGPTLGWARRVDRAFDLSLRELAHYLEARPDLDDVRALCGNMAFCPTRRSMQLKRYVARFGFEPVVPSEQRSLRQQMHLFGENFLISMMVLARNAAALHVDTLWRDRTLVLLSRRLLQRRYGLAGDRAA